MVLPFLVLLLGLQDNAQQLNQLQQEIQRVRTLVENELKPVCSSEVRFQAGDLRITDTATPVRANLFSMVSTPVETCLPAQIRITATYFDPRGAFICSGNLSISQGAQVQNTFFEFRPYESETFLKWWDGPTLKQQMLLCRDFQGNELRNPTDYATSLRIYATVFPKRGGLSTSEIQLNLPPLPRP